MATQTPDLRTLGAKAFAAIAAVEGLELGAASRRRLAALKSRDLTPEQRRQAILSDYRSASGAK